MAYVFLTGGTGLLGSYLIRDLLRAEVKLAVLVRGTRFESAVSRIENIVARWEKNSGHALPRPVVLEGNLTQPGLGLSSDAARWVAENCRSLLHNAASLTFHADPSTGEPWRSNLHGTGHVLEFARDTKIREFHHVSTAYVCGLRQDLVLESELDVGQKHGNDYEVSKFQAEQLVRGSDFLDSLTVYRPAIILGDSQTGYTTSFHSFYVPLKLVSTLLTRAAVPGLTPEGMSEIIKLVSEQLREILQLEGHEEKNLVPVDWCSRVIAEISTNPKHHQKTYHLTPGETTSVRLIQDAMEDIFLEKMDYNSKQTADSIDWDMFRQTFIEGMTVYRSHWKDDPRFDQQNLRSALPHLPCPKMDRSVIRRMCRFAIDSNFGWPRTIPKPPHFDVHARLRPVEGSLVAADFTEGDRQRPVHLGLEITGPGGGEWELTLDQGRLISARPGLSARCTATYYLNVATFERLAESRTDAQQAIGTGRVVIEGNGVPLADLATTLQNLAIAAGRSPNLLPAN
jgi:thioester reductase-like protein